MSKSLSVDDQVSLHKMYMEYDISREAGPLDGLLRYRSLWISFLDARISLPRSDVRRRGLSGTVGNVMFANNDCYSRNLAVFPTWVKDNQDASRTDKELSSGFSPMSTHFPTATLNKELKFKNGDWFLANPLFLLEGERASMWFGHIEAIFQHDGPTEKGLLVFKVRFSKHHITHDNIGNAVCMSLKVGWHPSPNTANGGAFDERLRTPIVPIDPLTERGMWPAIAVLPLLCWAPTKISEASNGDRLNMVPHHLRTMTPPHQPILARHWSILRYVGYPSAPSKEKWNSNVGRILKGVSWNSPVESDDEGEEDEDEEQEEEEEEDEEED